ncbi:hypothetical protein [Streptomyces sp. NPDC059957]|uniref:hypothetical protein n=1 Tax=unclassified Streptomyces TaxID=2593676 RepID=UPI003653021A
MHLALTLISLAPPPEHPERHVDRHQVTDIIWASAAPADRLEHVYARSAEGRLDIALYLFANTAEHAAESGQRLMRKVLAGAPALAGWTTNERAP